MTASRTSADGILDFIKKNALPLGHTDINGTQAAPFIELGNQSSQATFHLLAGVGSTAPYILGIGVDHDNSPTGVVTSVKGNNSIGIGTTLETTSGPDSQGFLGQNLSSGRLLRLVQGSAATGALLVLENLFGGTGKMLTWDTATTDGQIDSAGNMMLTGAAAEYGVQHAAASQNRAKLRVNTQGNFLDLDQFAGGTSWFAHRIDTTGSSLRIRKGTAAAGLGAATYATVLEFKDANSFAFMGQTPAPPAQRTLPAAGTVTADDIRALLITVGIAV